MSILLSAYYPEGIVFAADKNATITNLVSGQKHVEPTARKVIAWPNHKAIVGFVGLGTLCGQRPMDGWMEDFIAETKTFHNIAEVAAMLRDKVQRDFDSDYPSGTNLSDKHLVIHFGAFADRDGARTPVMYHIWNHGDIDPKGRGYPPAERYFKISEDLERDYREQSKRSDYPQGVRNWLEDFIKRGEYHWYNNGANLTAFNTFKHVIWHAVSALQDAGFAPGSSGLDQRAAFCKMAIEVFGAFFTHYYPPSDRAVGGGVDVEYIAWPT